MESERYGRRIRAFRKLKFVSQIELAKKLGMPLAKLSKLERGQMEFTDELLIDIARHLNIHVYDLTEDERFLVEVEVNEQSDDNDE